MFQAIAIGAALAVVIAGCGGGGGSSSKRFLYVGSRATGSINQFAITATGALTPLTPATVPTSTFVNGLARSSNGRYVYALMNSTGIAQFLVTPTGQLEPLSPATVNANALWGIDVRGDNLYIATGAPAVRHYKIGLDGLLAFQAEYALPVGAVPRHLKIRPGGNTLYVTNDGDNTISVMTIAANGSLSAATPASVPAESGPWSIDFTPNGSFAYVGNYDDETIGQYSVGANGALSALAPASVAGPTECYSVAISRSGNFLYSSSYAGANEIRGYSIGSNGTLTPLTPPSLGTASSAQWPLFVSSQNRLYVANQSADSVSAYTITPSGQLNIIGTYPAGDLPASFVEVQR